MRNYSEYLLGVTMSPIEEMMFSKHLEWIIFKGVDPESELFACLFLVKKGAFHFDSIGDKDYLAVCEHLDRIGIKHELKFGNRISLQLSTQHKI